MSQLGEAGQEGFNSIEWVEARDAASYPIRLRSPAVEHVKSGGIRRHIRVEVLVPPADVSAPSFPPRNPPECRVVFFANIYR